MAVAPSPSSRGRPGGVSGYLDTRKASRAVYGAMETRETWVDYVKSEGNAP